MNRKIVYICSPLRGDTEKNKIKAAIYERCAYEKGYLPLAPHTMFPNFLTDENKKERRDALEMGLQLLDLCDELWVFGPRISEGMKGEIEYARNNNIKTRYIENWEDL